MPIPSRDDRQRMRTELAHDFFLKREDVVALLDGMHEAETVLKGAHYFFRNVKVGQSTPQYRMVSNDVHRVLGMKPIDWNAGN